MVDIRRVLLRVLGRLKLEEAIEVIREKHPGWTPNKKPRRKADIQDKFLELSALIKEEEIEDFVQMAVMKKNVGFPAYTYKVVSDEIFKDLTNEEIIKAITKENFPFKDIYAISIGVENIGDKIELKVTLKEHESAWKTGANNIGSLSAVYTSKVSLDLQHKVLTIYSGNHQVQEEIVNFLQLVLKWPLQSYRVKEMTNQLVDLGSVSYKTSVLLDLMYNRLKEKGIESTFKEIKFDIGSKRRKDGIRNVAIGGKALLSSQLACEYITLGYNIVYFNVDMVMDGNQFSTKVFLKGQDLDILKIVILDTDNETIKKKAMSIIQNEYIDLCNTGIKYMPETKKLLEGIKERFVNQDQLIIRAIKDSTLESVKMIASILSNLDDQDEYVVNAIRQFADFNRTILDSVGYDDSDPNFDLITEFAGIRKEVVVDEEDEQVYEDVNDL